MQNRFGVILARITNELLITLSPGCRRQLVETDVDIFSWLFWWIYFLFTLFNLIGVLKKCVQNKNLRFLSNFIVFSLQGKCYLEIV